MKNQQKLALIKIGHPKHLDQFVNDENPVVRGFVAIYGNDKHRDLLLHDKDPDVRQLVAIHGNEHHAKALLNDPDYYVRHRATYRLRELGVNSESI
jgi:hypothetical protein